MDTRIFTALEQMAASTHNQQSMDVVYNHCLDLAGKHLAFLASLNGENPTAALFSKDRQDEAQTYVARLFTPTRETGNLLLTDLWTRYRSSELQHRMAPEAYLTAVVRKVISRQRDDVMRYLQPQEWKIRRSVQAAVESMNALRVVRIGSTKFAVARGVAASEHSCIDMQTLRTWCENHAEQSSAVYDLARRTAGILLEPAYRYRCLRINHLLRVILEYLASCYDKDISDRQDASSDQLEMLLDSAIIQPVQRQLTSIINSIYVRKGKISKAEAATLKTVMNAYLADLYNTGKTASILQYLSEAGVRSVESFYQQHANRLYYLTGLLKQHLAEMANRFLGEKTISEHKSIIEGDQRKQA